MNFKKSLKKASFYLIIGACLILIGLLTISSDKVRIIKPNISPSPFAVSTLPVTFAKVVRVIDGDTIVINSGKKVRYIGMNTPEIETNECFLNTGK